jgi:sugar phosphate isomerase/epimerase
MHLLCSTGAFSREMGFSDHRRMLSFANHFDVAGFEVLFYPQWYAIVDQVIEDVLEAGYRYVAVHTEKSIGPAMGSESVEEREIGLDRLAVNCRFAQALGARYIVLHLWGMPSSDKDMAINFAMLPRCLAIADLYNLEIAVETIPCLKHDPLRHIRRALELDKRAAVALDTEFLAMHNQLSDALEADWLWQDNAVRHIHFKDFDGQMTAPDGYRKYLHIGEGRIDFKKIFDILKRRNFGGAISLEASGVERDGKVGVEKIQGSLRELRKLMMG